MKDVKPDGGYTFVTGMVKPASRGTVRLTKADPAAPLAINPNYLAEQADVDAFVQGVELAIALGNGRGYSAMRNEQLTLRGANKGQIAEYVRANGSTYFHYSGTCAMGRDATVDEALRVRGVGHLRVIDASVIPEAPCCNTNPAVLSLAERAAELILAGA